MTRRRWWCQTEKRTAFPADAAILRRNPQVSGGTKSRLCPVCHAAVSMTGCGWGQGPDEPLLPLRDTLGRRSTGGTSPLHPAVIDGS